MNNKELPNNIIDAFNLLKNCQEMITLREALTEFFIEFEVDYKEFIDDLSDDLINTLLNKTNNKSLVMSKTGLSHRSIAKAIKNKNKPKVNLNRNLLQKAFSEINTYCTNNNTKGMPKLLFYANMRSYNDGKSSIKYHLDKLFDTGIIQQDENCVYLKLEKSVKKRSNEEIIAILGIIVKNLVNTIAFNKNNDGDADRLFQMYIASSQIPPELAPLAQKESLDALRVFYKQMNDLLTKYETDVKPGTYPRIGLSLFQYNENLK